MPSINLPENGALLPFEMSTPRDFVAAPRPLPRVAYAAAHVVADPLAEQDPWLDVRIDWDRTIAFRKHLWSLGLGVAEAMDTAQRGAGLDWTGARELIGLSLQAMRDVPGAFMGAGAGTDHLLPGPDVSVDDVIRAYEEQCEAVESLGGRVILMASRALAKAARGPADYERVYGRILGQMREPAIIHWLGDMFDPALQGYWGNADTGAAMEVALDVVAANAGKVDGIKISLLDDTREIAMRRRLPRGVRMYTGDDFNFAELIAGDEHGYSDALLGIFDPIAPAAAGALAALSHNDLSTYHEILAATVPLSRHMFRAPTQFYKTGVVFVAWLNGHQDHFVMAGGQQSGRSIKHFAELFRLADRAGLLRDPDLAAARMRTLLALHGVQ
jgi:hypothetical protein